MEMVRALAARAFRSLRGQVEFDELLSWGATGLIEAERRYDPSAGASFTTFAYYRVQGAIYDGIRKASGVPHINHPNFTWAMTAEELQKVERTRLFEIFNGHPQVNNVGGGDEAFAKLSNVRRHLDEISARPAAQRAVALKDKFAWKTEVDEEARKILFPQNAFLKS